MKIKIYYGGRGLLDDPTLYVLDKMEDVLKELRVTVERFNIYEHKNEISTLPHTFKDADGIILATTVEWLGIGGYTKIPSMGGGGSIVYVDYGEHGKELCIPYCNGEDKTVAALLKWIL